MMKGIVFILIGFVLPMVVTAQQVEAPKKAAKVLVEVEELKSAAKVLLMDGWELAENDWELGVVTTKARTFEHFGQNVVVKLTLMEQKDRVLVTGKYAIVMAGNSMDDAGFERAAPMVIKNIGMKKSGARRAWDYMLGAVNSIGKVVSFE